MSPGVLYHRGVEYGSRMMYDHTHDPVQAKVAPASILTHSPRDITMGKSIVV